MQPPGSKAVKRKAEANEEANSEQSRQRPAAPTEVERPTSVAVVGREGPAAPAPVSRSSTELYGRIFDTSVTGMAFADHSFSPVLAEVERPNVVQSVMHEQVQHYRLAEGSDEEVIAKPKRYRVRTKSKSERLLTGCREYVLPCDYNVKLAFQVAG